MSISKLDFVYNSSITVVSEKQYEEHLKLYDGYVEKINEIEPSLQQLPMNGNKTYGKSRDLFKGQSYALNGVILHELYFLNFGACSCESYKHDKMNDESLHPNPMTPSPSIKETIAKYFGSFEKWMDNFITCSKSARGWAILAYEFRSNRLINILLDEHDVGYIAYSFPLLVLDMYEHAYFLDYGTDVSRYIGNFLSNVNWNTVSSRVASAMDLSL